MCKRCLHTKACCLDFDQRALDLPYCFCVAAMGQHFPLLLVRKSLKNAILAKRALELPPPSKDQTLTLGPIHTGREQAHLWAILLMLLASSVNTPICNNRFHLVSLRVRIQCGLGLGVLALPDQNPWICTWRTCFFSQGRLLDMTDSATVPYALFSVWQMVGGLLVAVAVPLLKKYSAIWIHAVDKLTVNGTKDDKECLESQALRTARERGEDETVT